MNRTLYKMPRVQAKRVYFPEYSKEFENQIGPGPGTYVFENYRAGFNPQKHIGTKFTKVSFKEV